MNIHDLKQQLFSKTLSPVSPLDLNTTLSRQGNRWLHLTPTMTVKKSTVNEFTSEEHKLTLHCDQIWVDNLTLELKEATRSVIKENFPFK